MKFSIVAICIGVLASTVLFLWQSHRAMSALLLTEQASPERALAVDPDAYSQSEGQKSGDGFGMEPGTAIHKLANRNANNGEVVTFISIDELFVNVMAPNGVSHSLALKLEIELFDEDARTIVDEHQAGMRDTIIVTTRDYDYYLLNTISGKLYLKETLVRRINDFFHQPVVREIHFSSFFLQ